MMLLLIVVGYAVFCMVFDVGRWPPVDQRLAIGMFVYRRAGV